MNFLNFPSVSSLTKRILVIVFLTVFVSFSAGAQSPVFVRDVPIPIFTRYFVNDVPVPQPNVKLGIVTKSYVGGLLVHHSETILTTDGNGRASHSIPCYVDNTGVYGSGFEFRIQAIGRQGGYGGSGSTSECSIPEFPAEFGVDSESTEPDLENAGDGDSCSTNAGKLSSEHVGQPVNVTNGNMWIRHRDYNLPGVGEDLRISRFYNSVVQISGQSGIFGSGWQTDYDESLASVSGYLRFLSGKGQGTYFANFGNSVYLPASSGFYGSIVRNADSTYNLTFKDGRIHKFDSAGKLLWKKDVNGNQTTLTYNTTTGRLASIADPFGRILSVATNTNGTVSSMSDAFGLVATYTYDTVNPLLLKTVTYPDGSKYNYEYDTTTVPGKTFLKTVKDALGNILETHAYDAQGRATTSEKQGGVEKYTLDYSHWAEAAPYTQVTDALGRITKYYFDKSRGRNVVTKTDGTCSCGGGASSEITTYEYDAKLNLTKKTDALGRITTNTYDANGNRLTMTDVLGTETYTYNSFGQVLTRTDRMDGVTTNTYDPKGNLLTTKDPLNYTTTLTYTPIGQLSTVKDALNNLTTLTYDTLGRLSTVKDANLKITTYTYDLRSRLATVKNAKLETTTLGYDLNNRLNKITYPDLKLVSYAFDLGGRRTTMTDERLFVTTYGYDTANRLTSIKDALNHTKTIGYDLMSNVTSQTDALLNTTNYEYDDFNRLKKVIYPEASAGAIRLFETLTYDTVGNVKTRTDTGGRITSYDYDNANRLIKTIDANSQITEFGYNARSQMTQVIDALFQTYDFTYDPLGRQLSQTRAGATMNFVYDAVGNRAKRIDYNGKATTYEYDFLNRLKKINYLQGGDGTPAIANATYAYDDLSRLTSAVNENGTVSFTYNNRGRVATTTDVNGRAITYTYDAASNRTLLKLLNANHSTYVYDAANRLTKLTDEAKKIFTFAYDNADRLTTKTLPNTLATTYTYDGMSRLTRLRDAKGTTTLFDRNYSYDPANQISQIAEPTQTKIFSYDNLDRLTQMTNGVSNENYVFDSVGNRTASHRSASYSYQNYNQMTATSNATMSYDANGNMISRSQGAWTYVWDHENRMKSATSGATSVSYAYDALGRRVRRTQGTQITKFTYDGLDVVMDDVNGTLTKYQNGPGIDNKLKLVTGTTSSYFLTDHLGSTNALTNSTGIVTSSASYDSFGNQTGNLATRYSYTGREFDSFIGLNYYRSRWYDPNIGRFISEDPIGFKGGDVNLYGYVWNNPQNFVDPMGLDGWGSDLSDWLDDNIEYSRDFYKGDDQQWIRNGLVDTCADVCSGAADMFRIGKGTGDALFLGDENGYGRAAFFAQDVVRFSGLFSLLAGGGAKFANSPRGCALNQRLIKFSGQEYGGPNFRVAPFGNRTGDPLGELPHYHRRGPQVGPNESAPGQGIGRHRPWERSRHDNSWRDRF